MLAGAGNCTPWPLQHVIIHLHMLYCLIRSNSNRLSIVTWQADRSQKSRGSNRRKEKCSIARRWHGWMQEGNMI